MKFQKDDKVRLTGKFLQSTGQVAGGEGRKTWTVLGIDPGKYGAPDLVIVDEDRSDLGYWTEEEIKADPTLKYRRIAACNLAHVGKPTSRDV